MHPDVLVDEAGAARPKRHRLAVSVGGLAVLLGAIDAYVLVTILIQIRDDLNIPVNHLERVTPLITGYLLGYIAGMPLLGRLSDRYGRRTLILACLAGFAAGSIITATGHDLTQLIAGRAVQGLAGGALLPVTMALIADLFSAERRASALGWIGAAQELGAVVGPLFGAWAAQLFGTWRGIFWLNVPLAALASVAVFFMVPPKPKDSGPPSKVDIVGGLLLAISLGLFVVGLYNPQPDKSVLPEGGLTLLIAAGAVLVGFVAWEVFARTKLLDTTGVRMRPFIASLLTSFCAGAALLVTLVDVQLVAQTLLDKDSLEGALLLTRFLIALPVGAVLGGLLIKGLGERWLSVIGMLMAAGAYYLVSRWPQDVLAAHYDVAGLSLPRLDTDLIIAGLGLGLVIAPLSAVVLKIVPAAQHGIASAAIVVARMMGMLLGVAALSAWGLHRFQSLTADLPTPLPFGLTEEEYNAKLAVYEAAVQSALHTEYSEIFLFTSFICLAGALFALLLTGKKD